MSHVFISYKREDILAVEQLVNELKRHHFVWFDQTGIPGGVAWESQINQAIDDASALVLMLSPEALNSEWVQYEYRRALQAKCKLIPVMLKPCQLPDELRGLQSLEYAEFDKLMDALPDKSRIWGESVIPQVELKADVKFGELAAKFPKGILHPNDQLVGLPILQKRYSKLYLLGKKGDYLKPIESFQLALQLSSRNFSLKPNGDGAYPQDDFAGDIAAHFLSSPSKEIRLFLVQGPLNQAYDRPDRLGFGLNPQRDSEWIDVVEAANAARTMAKSKVMQLFINGPAIMSYRLGVMNAQYLQYELYQYDINSHQYACVLKG